MSLTRKTLLLLALLLALPLVLSCMTQSALTIEEQAQAIDKGLMCPICAGETIDQSQSTLAQQMREVVREKLAAGETGDQIIAYFVERYGESILAAPKKAGFSLVAWGMPVLGIVFGVGVLVLVVRRMRRPASQEPQGSSAHAGSGDGEMSPYLAVVDEDLRQLIGKGQSPPQSKAAS